MNAKLSIHNLCKIFGDDPTPAVEMLRDGKDKATIFAETGLTVGVRDASFAINEGEIFVVMGLSGSGKSTLVRLLNRLIEPTSGHILLDGVDIAALDAAQLREVRRKKIGMVFQSFALMPHMNVVDNVAFGLELDGADLDTRHRQAAKALERVGLSQHHSSYPDELSGGMQQRVGLARALCSNPDILLMDEAFSALDPLIRTEMQDELLRIQASDRRTVVFISHDLDEAVRIGDRIAVMEGGEVVQVGTPDEILNDPANDYVRSFFRGVDIGQVLTAGDVCSRRQVTIIRKGEHSGAGSALKLLNDEDREYGYVIDRDRRFVGVVSAESLDKETRQENRLDNALLDEPAPLPRETPVGDLLGDVAQAPCGVPVTDEETQYLGIITKSRLLETLARSEKGGG